MEAIGGDNDNATIVRIRGREVFRMRECVCRVRRERTGGESGSELISCSIVATESLSVFNIIIP